MTETTSKCCANCTHFNNGLCLRFNFNWKEYKEVSEDYTKVYCDCFTEKSDDQADV